MLTNRTLTHSYAIWACICIFKEFKLNCIQCYINRPPSPIFQSSPPTFFGPLTRDLIHKSVVYGDGADSYATKLHRCTFIWNLHLSFDTRAMHSQFLFMLLLLCFYKFWIYISRWEWTPEMVVDFVYKLRILVLNHLLCLLLMLVWFIYIFYIYTHISHACVHLYRTQVHKMLKLSAVLNGRDTMAYAMKWQEEYIWDKNWNKIMKNIDWNV